MRVITRISALVAGLVASVGIILIVTAQPAGAEVCGPDALVGLSFSTATDSPVAALSALGPLEPGDAVTMSWDGLAPGCDELDITLAAHRVDGSPTSELVAAEACTDPDCGGSISFVVPARTTVCRGELVAATGPPLLDRSLYGGARISATTIDAGECAPAAPSGIVTVQCARGGIDVSVANTGEVDAVFTVTVDGVERRRFEVSGGSERSELLTVTEDTQTTIAVGADGELLLERVLRPDCYPTPDVPVIVPDCAAGGASVILDNPTPEPMRYAVVVDGLANEVAVGAHRLERVSVPVDEHLTREIVVQTADATELTRFTIRADCERPRATVTTECASRSLVFTLANDGPTETMVDLLIDGSAIVSIPVPGGGDDITVRLDLGEDQTVVASAASSGVELTSRRLTLDCLPPTVIEPGAPPALTPTAPVSLLVQTPAVPRTQVLGVSVRRTASAGATQPLPVTGWDPRGLLVVAGLLFTLGGAFLVMSAGRETTGFGTAMARR